MGFCCTSPTVINYDSTLTLPCTLSARESLTAILMICVKYDTGVSKVLTQNCSEEKPFSANCVFQHFWLFGEISIRKVRLATETRLLSVGDIMCVRRSCDHSNFMILPCEKKHKPTEIVALNSTSWFYLGNSAWQVFRFKSKSEAQFLQMIRSNDFATLVIQRLCLFPFQYSACVKTIENAFYSKVMEKVNGRS